jgi:peroxiredoxin Q/BCP
MKTQLAHGAAAPGFNLVCPDGTRPTLPDLTQNQPIYLFFLRYTGCPICQMKLQELAENAATFQDAGIGITVVMQTSESSLAELAAAGALPFPIAADPGCEIFDLYGVSTVPVWRYVTPSVISGAMKAKKMGFSHGKRTGRELQAPAVFLIDKQQIIRYAYYGQNVGDLPDMAKLLEAASGIT